MQAETQTILTNDRIIALVVGIITLLGGGVLALAGYIWRGAMKQLKLYREESIAQRAEFNDALTNKFKAINHYMRQTDVIQVKHEKNVESLQEHARDAKSKIAEHEIRIGRHSEKIMEHDVEIKNLKNKQ